MERRSPQSNPDHLSSFVISRTYSTKGEYRKEQFTKSPIAGYLIKANIQLLLINDKISCSGKSIHSI